MDDHEFEMLKDHLMRLDARVGQLENQAAGHRDGMSELRTDMLTRLRAALRPTQEGVTGT